MSETPKELMDCILSPEEISEAVRKGIHETDADIARYSAEAQLQSSKHKAYIEAKVQAERERHSQRLQYIWLIAQKAALERALPDSSHRDTLLRPPSIDLVEEYTNCLLPKEEVV